MQQVLNTRRRRPQQRQRSQYEIIKAILDALPERKTKIRFKAQMNFLYFNCYFNLILDRGLAEIDLVHRRYFLSQKGKEYLAAINEILILQR